MTARVDEAWAKAFEAMEKFGKTANKMADEFLLLRQLIMLIPAGEYIARRYDTDNEVVLYIWSPQSGQSYDIKFKKPEFFNVVEVEV